MLQYLIMKDKIFKDKNGQVVLFQWPNVPLIAWGVFLVLSRLVAREPYHAIFEWLSFIGIVVWAGLEIVYGVNYFRRAIGLLVFVIVVGSKLMHLYLK